MSHQQGSPVPAVPELSLRRNFALAYSVLDDIVDGLTELADAGRAVSVFGSARVPGSNRNYYSQARSVGRMLAERGYCVLTGGGPGIMEAASRGAIEAGGTSIGLNIALPAEQVPNAYLSKEVRFRTFVVRRLMFRMYSGGTIVFPGGFGTLDEFSEMIALLQTGSLDPRPLALVGRDYWSGLIGWMSTTMGEKHRFIRSEDMDLFLLTDNEQDAVDHVTGGEREDCFQHSSLSL